MWKFTNETINQGPDIFHNHHHQFQPENSICAIFSYTVNFINFYARNQPEDSTCGTFLSTINFLFSGWKSTVIDVKIYEWDYKAEPGHFPQPSPSISTRKFNLRNIFIYRQFYQLLNPKSTWRFNLRNIFIYYQFSVFWLKINGDRCENLRMRL